MPNTLAGATLDGRVFTVAANSAHGAVSDATRFLFREDHGSIRASYRGGAVKHGSIVGRRISESTLTLRYQCVLVSGDVRAGTAEVTVGRGDSDLLTLDMAWQWLDGGLESGTSSYVEVPTETTFPHALYSQAHEAALDYLERSEERPVFPTAAAIEALTTFDEPMPEAPTPAEETMRLLDGVGSPATVNQITGRYFGFVNGGALPSAVAARFLADAWDQNAAMAVMSPVAARLESVCEQWLVDLLGLPQGTACGFVSGTSASLIGAVATARDALLSRQGHDVRAQGLFGLPEIRVVVGDHVHVSALRALSLSGLGEQRVERVPVDDQGRMRAELLPALDETTLVLCQAGNVNSGAFDPVGEVCDRAAGTGAWVHVDGAFGLWAGASENTRHLYRGIERADSWSTDAHKTLNVPYDSGLLLVRDGNALRSTLLAKAAYLTAGNRDGMSHTLEMSRRARVVELWAVLKTLGRSGVEELIDRLCFHARGFASQLADRGFKIENDVVFNQVLVACDDATLTERTLSQLQSSGECWCGAGSWFGDPVIRVSVCSWATDEEDVSRSVDAFVAAREEARRTSSGEIA